MNFKEKTYKLDFETDYGQFYIINNKEYIEYDIWNDENLKNRMAVSDGLIAVIIESRYFIKGELFLYSKDKGIKNVENFDHIVEGGIDVINGFLIIEDCPTGSTLTKIKLPNGPYRIRVYSKGIKNIIGDSFEDQKDRYRIEIFPGKSKAVKVIKMLEQ